jgi:hypothetical protein
MTLTRAKIISTGQATREFTARETESSPLLLIFESAKSRFADFIGQRRKLCHRREACFFQKGRSPCFYSASGYKRTGFLRPSLLISKEHLVKDIIANFEIFVNSKSIHCSYLSQKHPSVYLIPKFLAKEIFRTKKRPPRKIPWGSSTGDQHLKKRILGTGTSFVGHSLKYIV